MILDCHLRGSWQLSPYLNEAAMMPYTYIEWNCALPTLQLRWNLLAEKHTLKRVPVTKRKRFSPVSFSVSVSHVYQLEVLNFSRIMCIHRLSFGFLRSEQFSFVKGANMFLNFLFEIFASVVFNSRKGVTARSDPSNSRIFFLFWCQSKPRKFHRRIPSRATRTCDGCLSEDSIDRDIRRVVEIKHR